MDLEEQSILAKLLEDLQFAVEETQGDQRVQLVASFLNVIQWYCDPDMFDELAGAFTDDCMITVPDNDPLWSYLYKELYQ